MAEYRFLTTWLLDAPIATVWSAIHDVEAWPEWWLGVRSVTKLEEGDQAGVGAVYAHRWRSVLPYTVSFTTRVRAIEEPFLVEAEANGELAGTSRWRLYEGTGTAVTYEWNVRTTREWMNALALVAGPVFAWNHHAIMRRGGDSIANGSDAPSRRAAKGPGDPGRWQLHEDTSRLRTPRAVRNPRRCEHRVRRLLGAR